MRISQEYAANVLEKFVDLSVAIGDNQNPLERQEVIDASLGVSKSLVDFLQTSEWQLSLSNQQRELLEVYVAAGLIAGSTMFPSIDREMQPASNQMNRNTAESPAKFPFLLRAFTKKLNAADKAHQIGETLEKDWDPTYGNPEGLGELGLSIAVPLFYLRKATESLQADPVTPNVFRDLQGLVVETFLRGYIDDYRQTIGTRRVTQLPQPE